MRHGSGLRSGLLRALRGAALALVLLPLLYLSAALAGSIIPANASWQEPEEGVTIFVETNGVHTWIVVPTVNAEMDWRPLVPIAHIRDQAPGRDHVGFGFGNREFYLNTPRWRDLTPGRAARALLGLGPALVHVYHQRAPVPSDTQRPIRITPEQYRRLTAFIVASFVRDAEGRTVPLIGSGYGDTDVFYEAHGRYNLFFTCNEWVGAALRTAGVRVGLWTPFTQSIMLRF